MAVKGLVLLLLFLNFATVPLFSGAWPTCTCRLPGSKIRCCSFNIPQANNSPAGTMICYCQEKSEKRVEYRQGCRCGLDRKSITQPPFLLLSSVTGTGINAGGYMFTKDPGKPHPGFENPPLKPPPGSDRSKGFTC